MQAPSLLIILVLFAFAKDVVGRRHSHRSRHEEKIVGGSNDTVQNNPYIVYIILEDTNQTDYQCGGSIISENYVLTAAHCTKDILKATIRAGSSEANSGGQQYESAKIIQHPNYDPKNFDNDVAIIQTTQPIKLDGTNTKAVQLPKQGCEVNSGTNIKVAGWGATEEDGDVSPNLMSVVVQALSNDSCSQDLGYGLTDCQFCAGAPKGGKDSCQGDSGGPAVVSDSARSKHTRRTCRGQTGTQVGIVSNGVGCARPGKPGVYTRIACKSVRQWIKMETGV